MITILVAICFIFVVLAAYSITRYYVVSKRNKASERANEMIFLAKIQAQQREKSRENNQGTIECKPEPKLSDFSKRKNIPEDSESLKQDNQNNEEKIPWPVIPDPDAPRPPKLSDFF